MGTLMSACNDADGFQTITHHRCSQGKNCSHTADAVSSTPIPQVTCPQTGQCIPVITTSSTVDASNVIPTTYSDVTAGRRRPSADVIIIGTSLTRGVSHELQQQGMQAENVYLPRCHNSAPKKSIAIYIEWKLSSKNSRTSVQRKWLWV